MDIYRRYLAKFTELFGELDFNGVVRHRGALIKKLRYEDFVSRWTEFKQIEDYLREVMSTGATLNDDVNRSYRELAAIVLETPKDFMLL
jgi:hypothetical protein